MFADNIMNLSFNHPKNDLFNISSIKNFGFQQKGSLSLPKSTETRTQVLHFYMFLTKMVKKFSALRQGTMMKYRNIRHFSSSLPSLQSRTVSHRREPEIHLRSSRHWNSPSAHSKTASRKHTIGNDCFSKTYTCFKQALKFLLISHL